MLDLFGRRARRRARLRAIPLPENWQAILNKNVPLYGKLSSKLKQELHGHIRVLLDEKKFEGCGGLVLTDEILVTIAAHAGLLLLGRKAKYYPGLCSILVYPTTVRVPRREYLGDGTVAEERMEIDGLSSRYGAIVIVWDAALAGARLPDDGRNVILHEFAHQLDTEDGSADGVPYLNKRSDYVTWAQALHPEYERLRGKPAESLLSSYGGTNPAEFFAVATEAFFEKPEQLRDHHPELYRELKRFYRIDVGRGDVIQESND